MSEQPSGQVESVDQLREFYDDPSLLSQQKFMETLDDHCRAMIARSSFYCIATMNPDGSLDISPRGILRDRSLCLILRPCCCPIAGGTTSWTA